MPLELNGLRNDSKAFHVEMKKWGGDGAETRPHRGSAGFPSQLISSIYYSPGPIGKTPTMNEGIVSVHLT